MTKDIVQWLLDHYGQEQFQPGLTRIKRALDSILPNFKTTKIVTIAGTNGKGETTLRLSQYLKQTNHCVWISPHVERITERFRSEEGEIDEAQLWEVLLKCHEVVIREKYELSYYEFLFFAFCTWAQKRNPKILLLEVGLGGRLDAVNVFDADFVLLPSISRDHQEFLGRRYDEILKEKLALLRPQSTLISFLDLKYLTERTKSYAESVGAKAIDLNSHSTLSSWDFSARNQFLAYAAFNFLNSKYSFENWQKETSGLEHRGEVMREHGEWVFFGSHNPDGLRKLILFLHSGNYNFQRPPFDAVIAAFSRRDSRDLTAMLKMLKASGLGKIVITTFPHPKAASREVMESLARQEGLDFAEDIASFVHGKNEGPHLVLGSYYFMGHMQSIIRGGR